MIGATTIVTMLRRQSITIATTSITAPLVTCAVARLVTAMNPRFSAAVSASSRLIRSEAFPATIPASGSARMCANTRERILATARVHTVIAMYWCRKFAVAPITVRIPSPMMIATTAPNGSDGIAPITDSGSVGLPGRPPSNSSSRSRGLRPTLPVSGLIRSRTPTMPRSPAPIPSAETNANTSASARRIRSCISSRANPQKVRGRFFRLRWPGEDMNRPVSPDPPRRATPGGARAGRPYRAAS